MQLVVLLVLHSMLLFATVFFPLHPLVKSWQDLDYAPFSAQGDRKKDEQSIRFFFIIPGSSSTEEFQLTWPPHNVEGPKEGFIVYCREVCEAMCLLL